MGELTKGAMAGLAGVTAMVGVITTLRRALLMSEQLAASRTHPEKIVQAIATRAGYGELDDMTRRRAGDAIHFGYGALWGAVIAAVTRGGDVSVVRHGVPLAAGLWAIGFNVLLPALRAHPGPWTWQRREFILTGTAHAACGVGTAAALRWLRDTTD